MNESSHGGKVIYHPLLFEKATRKGPFRWAVSKFVNNVEYRMPSLGYGILLEVYPRIDYIFHCKIPFIHYNSLNHRHSMDVVLHLMVF